MGGFLGRREHTATGGRAVNPLGERQIGRALAGSPGTRAAAPNGGAAAAHRAGPPPASCMGRGAASSRIRPSQVSVKTAATVTFTVVGIGALVMLVIAAREALAIIVAALLLAVALHKAADVLLRRGWRRGWAMATVLLCSFALGISVLLLIVPPAVRQGVELVRHGPAMVDRIRQSRVYREIDARIPLDRQLRAAMTAAEAHPGEVVNPAVRAAKVVGELVGAAAAVIGTAVFLVIFGGGLVQRALAEAVPERRKRYERVLYNAYHAVGGYLAGLATLCAVEAAMATTAFGLIGVPFFVPLGLLAGLAEIVPIAGALVSATLVCLVALAAGGVREMIAVAVFYAVYQQLQAHVLAPLIYRRTVRLNPLVTVLSLLVLTDLLGIPGAVIAIPAVASAEILLRELLAYRREQLEAPAQGPLSVSAPPPSGGPAEHRVQ